MTIHHELTALIEDPAAALRYVLGGQATFTLRSKRTGTRFTYHVNKSDDGKVFFVKVLTGADNVNNYQFIGTIFDAATPFPVFRYSRKSRITTGAPSVVAFVWAFSRLAAGVAPAELEIWHSGSCGRCGRRLTVPESVASGFGPECARLIGG